MSSLTDSDKASTRHTGVSSPIFRPRTVDQAGSEDSLAEVARHGPERPTCLWRSLKPCCSSWTCRPCCSRSESPGAGHGASATPARSNGLFSSHPRPPPATMSLRTLCLRNTFRSGSPEEREQTRGNASTTVNSISFLPLERRRTYGQRPVGAGRWWCNPRCTHWRGSSVTGAASCQQRRYASGSFISPKLKGYVWMLYTTLSFPSKRMQGRVLLSVLLELESSHL